MPFFPAIALLASLVGVLTASLLDADQWQKLTRAAWQAHEQKRYAEAESLFLDALKEAESFGEKDRRLSASLNDLASFYQVQGEYRKALPYHLRTISIREKESGPVNVELAGSLNALSILYRKLGMYREAESASERALGIYEQI